MRSKILRATAALIVCVAMGAASPIDALAAARLPSLALRPAAPAPSLERLIGDYGTPDSLLTVYEAHGRLLAEGVELHRIPLRRVNANRFVTDSNATVQAILQFAGSPGRQADAVKLNGVRLPRRDLGNEVVATIRAGERSDLTALRREALAATPPVEPPAPHADDLVDLAGIDASLKFDIRYATRNNFMGFPLYERADAYMQRVAADALGAVAHDLRPLGYGLLIHDAYRPWFVTKMFWDAVPDEAHVFVADPSAGSRHNRGCAVDLTLYELRTGAAVQMTGRYDEMSHRSYADYFGGTSQERWLRDLLRQAMEQKGFTVYPQEWWHFDYKDWHDYAIGNVQFEKLVHR